MQLYNSLGRERQEFVPARPGEVGIYVCGATVQSAPHLGHGRYAVVFDVIRRYFEWLGYRVTYVTNVTDIDDKIIAAANEQGRPTEEIAAEVGAQFEDAFRRLGIKEADVTPQATQHVPEMISLIEDLIARGHAYPADGDVYFSVRSFPAYGRLSGRNVDDLLSGARVEPGEHKQDPLDFALWKAAKPGEPSWDSPWGEGRPGWHIECSVMATRYLGFGFDIHGGGTDLVFPHHENEIAQSEAGAGAAPFARYWLHNGMLTMQGEKMAKSTGLVVDLLGALDAYHPLAVRLFYLRKRYREPFDFSDEGLADAAAQLERLWAFRRRDPGPTDAAADSETMQRFRAAMDDDFNTSEALAALFDAVREGNRHLDAGEDAGPYVAAYDEVMGVLGLAESAQGLTDLAGELAALAEQHGVAAGEPAEMVGALIERRNQAREERDWPAADGLRDSLTAIGITLEDSADGTRWHRG